MKTPASSWSNITGKEPPFVDSLLFKDLSGSVLRVEPDRTSAPMIDHAAHVLLDGDIPWTGWSAAYDFLVKYWGKDFRPVERRGKPVEPSEREAIVAAFESEYAAADESEPPPGNSQAVPAGSAGMAKGK